MPLVVVCGQPCSGKSTAVQELVVQFRAQGLQVAVVDELALGLNRNTSYQDVSSEKNTRGTLRSAVERSLSKKSVLIFDSLNNIKVHVDTPTQQCSVWNAARGQDSYTQAIFDDLAGRFERPDSRNRWDSPLFEVRPGRDSPEEITATLQSVVAAVAGPGASLPGGAHQVGRRAQDLQPTCATVSDKLAGTNVLHEIDCAAQDILDCISEASMSAAGGAPGLVNFGEDVPALKITQPVTLAELRRLKRDFLRLATKNTFTRLQDSTAARAMFVEYLHNNLHA